LTLFHFHVFTSSLKELLTEDWNKTLVFRYRPDALNYVLDLESNLLLKVRTTRKPNTRGGVFRKIKCFTRGILINQLGLLSHELDSLGR
jgi:hypothetical protein